MCCQPPLHIATSVWTHTTGKYINASLKAEFMVVLVNDYILIIYEVMNLLRPEATWATSPWMIVCTTSMHLSFKVMTSMILSFSHCWLCFLGSFLKMTPSMTQMKELLTAMMLLWSPLCIFSISLLFLVGLRSQFSLTLTCRKQLSSQEEKKQTLINPKRVSCLEIKFVASVNRCNGAFSLSGVTQFHQESEHWDLENRANDALSFCGVPEKLKWKLMVRCSNVSARCAAISCQ